MRKLQVSILLLLLVVCAHFQAQAQEFYTGQAARLIIGQKTFTEQFPGNSDELLGASAGVAYANNMLFIADSSRIGAEPSNHRVLVYRDVNSFVPRPTDRFVQGSRCPACVGKANVVLGQPSFSVLPADMFPSKVAATTMRQATAVASDGNVVAVADTDFNRILIWRNIPGSNGQPADIVLGQEALDKLRPIATNSRSLRGPQGLWIQNGRLFVADTQNHRVLIWNSIPTRNDQPADVVLGQPSFDVVPQVDLTRLEVAPKQDNMLNPVSVTSDGTRLFVSDLGHNRVLIWNSIPTRNTQPADVVLGQPDFVSAIANNSTKLCPSNGVSPTDSTILRYPRRCGATLDFPRFALSDGKRLFVADGGADRVLIWNNIPTTNGAKSDATLGQLSDELNLTSDSAFPGRVSASDVIRTPTSLAFDGANLYVADPYNRRVLVYTPGPRLILDTGVRNAASREIFAVGTVQFGGTVTEGEEISIKVNNVDPTYKYKFVKDDTFNKAITSLVNDINAGNGNPSVLATPLIRSGFNAIILTARSSGEPGNAVTFTATIAPVKEGDTPKVTISAGSGTLAGGQDAAQIAAGTLVTIFGNDLTDKTAALSMNAPELPRGLLGTEVFFDGISAPILSISPTQITAQVPLEVIDASSSNAIVRSVRNDGRVVTSAAIGVPLIAQNPGIFADDGVDPRPGIITHYSSSATATISLDGTVAKDNVATININGRAYAYKAVDNDTNLIVRNKLIDLINANGGDPDVVAFPSGFFTRIRLQSRKLGPDGNGTPISVSTNEGAGIILTAFNNQLCCANVAGARVTEENPAVPGETIVLLATGLGPVLPEAANQAVFTGNAYSGPELNDPVEFVSALAGGRTANVLLAALKVGLIGIYEVHLELNTDLDSNPKTQLTIAQSFQVSNIVYFPVKNVAKDAGTQP
jgi:uncharacterized protein (TIGR03437 family)